MACTKWEDEGFLYFLKEMPESEISKYESHLAECSVCSSELKEHQQMFGSFSVGELLEEIPSEECDKKVLAALEQARQEMVKPQYMWGGVFTMLIQRVAVPLLIFLATVSIGFTISSKQNQASSTVAEKSVVADSLSSTDSLSDTARVFMESTQKNGAVPVSLEK